MPAIKTIPAGVLTYTIVLYQILVKTIILCFTESVIRINLLGLNFGSIRKKQAEEC